MKNVFNNIISKLAFVSASLLFGLSAFAQDGAVKYDKKVTPDPDPNGVYTISLEAFVTGSVTVTEETFPADIILVLDYSTSMYKDMAGNGDYEHPAAEPDRRINLLRSSVSSFVTSVQESNSKLLAKDKDALGGHRIAFVLYSGTVYTPGKQAGMSSSPFVNVPNNYALNTFLNVEDLTATEESTGAGPYSAATVSYSGNDLIGLGVSRGTHSGDAMEMAQQILAGVNYPSGSKRTRVVVFFTDGEPGGTSNHNWYNSGSQRKQQADLCISSSNTIKNSTTYGATVYSVGLFNAQPTANEITTFMAYSSSDYTDRTFPTSNAGPFVNTGNYSIIVSSSSELANVFTSIATSTGGDYSASSASSVMIDVVATSFEIPTDADLGSVRVWRVPAVKPSQDAILTFNESAAFELFVVATEAELNAITDPDRRSKTVCLTTDTETGEVSVTGFDYGKEWCGYDEANNVSHGHKLVLTIPITVKEDAVGGPHVNTNTADSKLIIKDKDGNVISTNVFPRPYLRLPVSIWIQKTGLLEDDSAVFNLRRTPYVGPDVDYSAESIKWDKEWGYKIVCNKDTMDENGVVKVSGLSPDYVYKIYEDAWGSLGYIYQDDDTLYTVGGDVENPFKFKNTPREVKFDEAVVRNVFKKKEAAPSE